MTTPRRKPWEVASGTSSAAVSGGESTASAPMGSVTGISNLSTGNEGPAVAVPERPTSLTSDLSSVSNTSPYGSNSYGTSSYGSGYGNRYGSSMYSGGYGGYGSSMYGGGYGSSMYGGGYGSSMYGMGGYGSSMYGMGGYGNGMYGQPGMGGGLAEGTQATFQLIESIIGAVGGFAQMLEATYMATHSSFFTMVSLAEQFGNLKNALGSLLGIYALINFAKKMFYKITGRNYNHGINLKEFSKFESKQKKIEENLKRTGGSSRISFKPLLLFLAASIGFPYLLSKAIQKLNEQQQRRSLSQQGQQGQPGQPGQPGQLMGQQAGSFDPNNLQFAKAMYEFNPENPNIEIELKPNDLVAILSKLDPLGNESKWWKVRSRSGKVGYVPSNYLTVIERKPKPIDQAQPLSPPSEAQVNQMVEEFKKG